MPLKGTKTFNVQSSIDQIKNKNVTWKLRKLFRCLLKVSCELQFLKLVGRVFHSLGPVRVLYKAVGCPVVSADQCRIVYVLGIVQPFILFPYIA